MIYFLAKASCIILLVSFGVILTNLNILLFNLISNTFHSLQKYSFIQS